MRSSIRRPAELLLLLGAFASHWSCAATCHSDEDCDDGSYCVQSADDVVGSGSCVSECVTAEDCKPPSDPEYIAVCNSFGRCGVEPLEPFVRVTSPENDSLLEEGTRRVSIEGSVETVSEKTTVTVKTERTGGCSGGEVWTAVAINREPGIRTKVPFLIDAVDLDPGFVTLAVRAEVVGGAFDTVNHFLEIACPGCAEIAIEEPTSVTPVLLDLPLLSGTISPDSVESAIWRVRSTAGDVFDGRLTVESGRFAAEGIPLFAGKNRVEVVVTGVGEGLGEGRCSTTVTSQISKEVGLRALLSWDGPTSDLDLHLIGPNGLLGDPRSDLSSYTRTPDFGGEIRDVFDGYGPEMIILEQIPDGVYGLVVQPVFDDQDPGSSAFVRILLDGRSVTRGAVGPKWLSAAIGELWIVGTLSVSQGVAAWESINELIDGANPPTQPPSMWPQYY